MLYRWQTAGSVQFQTEFRQYDTALVFLQIWPGGANRTATSANLADSHHEIVASFPAFLAKQDADSGSPPRGYANWDGGQGVPNEHWMTTIGSTTAAVRGTGVWPPGTAVLKNVADSDPYNTSKDPTAAAASPNCTCVENPSCPPGQAPAEAGKYHDSACGGHRYYCCAAAPPPPPSILTYGFEGAGALAIFDSKVFLT